MPSPRKTERPAIVTTRFIVLLLVSLAVGCQRQETEKATPSSSADGPSPALRMYVGPSPTAIAGGYLHAASRNHYEKSDLQVELVFEASEQPLTENEVVICDALTFIERRITGEDLVAVLAPVQTNPACVFVWTDSALTGGLDKLDGVTIHGQPDLLAWKYLSLRYEMQPLRIVEPDPEFVQFAKNPICAVSGDRVHDPGRVKKSGVAATSLLIADSGFNPYPGLLVVPRSLLTNQPEQVRSLIDASIRGWLGFLSAPASVGEELAQHNLKLNAADWTDAGTRARKFVLTGAAEDGVVGLMTVSRWAQLLQQLHQLGLDVDQAGSPGELFSNEFH